MSTSTQAVTCPQCSTTTVVTEAKAISLVHSGGTKFWLTVSLRLDCGHRVGFRQWGKTPYEGTRQSKTYDELNTSSTTEFGKAQEKMRNGYSPEPFNRTVMPVASTVWEDVHPRGALLSLAGLRIATGVSVTPTPAGVAPNPPAPRPGTPEPSTSVDINDLTAEVPITAVSEHVTAFINLLADDTTDVAVLMVKRSMLAKAVDALAASTLDVTMRFTEADAELKKRIRADLT